MYLTQDKGKDGKPNQSCNFSLFKPLPARSLYLGHMVTYSYNTKFQIQAVFGSAVYTENFCIFCFLKSIEKMQKKWTLTSSLLLLVFFNVIQGLLCNNS